MIVKLTLLFSKSFSATLPSSGSRLDATLLYKERLETFNDYFVFLNVALFRSDCVIINILFLLAAQRIGSV